MDSNDFFEHLLELPDLKVLSVEYHPKKIICYCELKKGSPSCPNCGAPTSVLNQYKTRKVRDLDISGKEVWFHLRVGQYVCEPCNRYFNQETDWLLPEKSYTKRQAKWMFEMCAKQPFSEVGALLNICPKTVERFYYAEAKKRINLPKPYQEVQYLGIDEISHRKGKGDYVCVLVDLEKGIELDVLPDRKKASLKAHFEKLGESFCAQIKVVCCDMWKTYLSIAKECFPNATTVIDRFHVVKALNEVLDKLRKKLRREFKQEDCFKDIKWKLFKRPENCSQAELDELQNALTKSWELEEVYHLRNSFNDIFDIAINQEDCNKQLNYWIGHAQMLNNEPMDKFLKTLKKWQKQITAFAENRVTNAVTEGLNNYIRYFKRISFGLPNFEHMRLRILMATT